MSKKEKKQKMQNTAENKQNPHGNEAPAKVEQKKENKEQF